MSVLFPKLSLVCLLYCSALCLSPSFASSNDKPYWVGLEHDETLDGPQLELTSGHDKTTSDAEHARSASVDNADAPP